MKKTVLIYQKPNQLIFQAYAQSTQGFTIADVPIIKLPNSATTEEVETTVFAVLRHIRNDVIHPSDWPKFEKEDVKRLGFKSRKEMHTDCKACLLSFDGRSVSVIPSINRKTGFDYLPPTYEVKTTDIQPESIGTAVLQALEYSKCN